MSPEISIIIPFRDQIALLQQCLNSLLEVVGDNKIELLLLNNRSKQEELQKLVLPKGISSHVIDAAMDFHFQKLINLGARHAQGRFLLLLNNDIIFTKESKGCLEKMCCFAADPHVGAAGPLLLYPDGTIQHAGVVVGMNDTADHLYRGWTCQQAASFPFCSPHENRYVSAVTAACLMVEKTKFDQIGGMDERFIVCGGDVDLCLRLHHAGYKNVYLGDVSLIHLESKTRDPFAIPKIDFTESKRSYGEFLARHKGRDPYYPEPLPLTHHPHSTKRKKRSIWDKCMRHFARSYHEPLEKVIVDLWVKVRRKFFSSHRSFVKKVVLDDIRDYRMRKLSTITVHPVEKKQRLTILVPSLQRQDIYGGIATACLIGFSYQLKHPETELRFLVTDGGGDHATLKEVMRTFLGERCESVMCDIQNVTKKECPPVFVHDQDFFLATVWWTCYQIEHLCRTRPFFYLIQDFEPGFYEWSDEYAAALSTYHFNHIPLFNSHYLKDFFDENNLMKGKEGLYFDPLFSFNPVEKKKKGKKTLFFYGRRSVARNLFKTGVCALAQALDQRVFDKDEWEFLSAGEDHPSIELAPNVFLKSLGKLSLEEYWNVLSRVDIGLSLMLSPHPSYPPLELASAGAVCVTNTFANKNLSTLSDNIISCDPSIAALAEGLKQACEKLDQQPNQKPCNLRNDIETVLQPVLKGINETLRHCH